MKIALNFASGLTSSCPCCQTPTTHLITEIREDRPPEVWAGCEGAASWAKGQAMADGVGLTVWSFEQIEEWLK